MGAESSSDDAEDGEATDEEAPVEVDEEALFLKSKLSCLAGRRRSSRELDKRALAAARRPGNYSRHPCILVTHASTLPTGYWSSWVSFHPDRGLICIPKK